MMGQPLSRLWSAAPLCKGSQCAGKSLPYEGEAFVGNPPRKVSPFRLVETRVAHFDKKEPGTRIASRLSLVETIGIEPTTF